MHSVSVCDTGTKNFRNSGNFLESKKMRGFSKFLENLDPWFIPDWIFAVRFALYECEARSGPSEIELYEGNCPAESAERINLDWVDFTTFQMSIFKMSDRDTLNVACTVQIFPGQDFLPDSCDDNDRRRRRDISDNDQRRNQGIVAKL